MPRFSIESKTIAVGGQQAVIRALTARDRQAISSRCKTGEEMTHQAVLLCTTEPAVEGQPAVPFFADLAEVLDSPCGHIAKLGEEILALSGMDVGDKANPT